MDRAIELRSKCKHFRTLIIGRANAGKTTLLKKVCNSIEDPEIFSPSGKKLDPAVVQESSERGIHDITNQLIFKSNPQFIFHDSRGFESGSLDEIETVKSFITECARSSELPEQLHVIWYCLPTDTNRPLLEADRKFFDEYGNGKVPVIAIFTKFDGLVTTAFSELREKEKLSIKEARNGKFERAREKLKTNFIEPLTATASRPSDYVRLDDMRKEGSNCAELIEKTANVLDDDTLKLLFVSVQQNNIDICIHNAVWYSLLFMEDRTSLALLDNSLAWFPHVWTDFEYDQRTEISISFTFNEPKEKIFSDNVDFCTQALLNMFPSLDKSLQTASGYAEFLALICICAEQTFTQASAKTKGFAPAFSDALQAYVTSTVRDDVNEAIGALLDGRDELGGFISELLQDVIKKHRLCIKVDTT